MSNLQPTSRREFLAISTGGLAFLGVHNAFGDQSSTPSAKTPFIRTQARRARKISVAADDRILVAADRAILSYDRHGAFESKIELERPARCLATGADGQLYVGLFNHIIVFDAHRQRIHKWQEFGPQAILGGIAVAGNNIFVADAGNKVVWRLDNTGRVLNRIERGPAGFQAPAEFFSIATQPDGGFHLAHAGRHRVETYSPAGEFVSAWGRRSRDLAGFSGCCNPVSVATLANGSFITAERGVPRVKLYSAEGQFERLLAGPELFADNRQAAQDDQATGCQSAGLDIAVDSRQRILILDRETANIHCVSRV